MSAPRCFHWFGKAGVFHSYTRTCPALEPFPLLNSAPIATIVPSAERLTEYPLKSVGASPSMSAPRCFHWFGKSGVFHSYTRTCPAFEPFPSLYRAPIATIVPSSERLTEYPLWSLAASPSMSAPHLDQKAMLNILDIFVTLEVSHEPIS